jgi:hypothetical protein
LLNDLFSLEEGFSRLAPFFNVQRLPRQKVLVFTSTRRKKNTLVRKITFIGGSEASCMGL